MRQLLICDTQAGQWVVLSLGEGDNGPETTLDRETFNKKTEALAYINALEFYNQ